MTLFGRTNEAKCLPAILNGVRYKVEKTLFVRWDFDMWVRIIKQPTEAKIRSVCSTMKKSA